MLGFLMEHMGTIVVSLLLLLSVAAIIINMSKKREQDEEAAPAVRRQGFVIKNDFEKWKTGASGIGFLLSKESGCYII